MFNYRISANITAEGDTREDVIIALREVIKKIDDGYLAGHDQSEDGEYEFTVTE